MNLDAEKIVAICQVYNELEKGNLERFLSHLFLITHAVIVYDDASTDGSPDYLEKRGVHVIRGEKNDFNSELGHKKLLLERARSLGATFVLFLDADEVLTAGAEYRLPDLCRKMREGKIDGARFKKINLWRSATWQRVDSLFGDAESVSLWRVSESLQYGKVRRGLHQRQYPSSIKKILDVDSIKILHYAYFSDKALAYKYFIYKHFGQRGYIMLDRHVDESELALVRVPKIVTPSDLWVENDPMPLQRSQKDALLSLSVYREMVEKSFPKRETVFKAIFVWLNLQRMALQVSVRYRYPNIAKKLKAVRNALSRS